MDRDYQFEVQYLLTVTIAVTAMMASQYLRPLFDIHIGYVFLIAISVHIVLINHLYVIQQVGNLTMEIEETLDEYSQYSLFAVTLIIPFLIFHAILTPISNLFVGILAVYVDHMPENMVVLINISVQILMVYVAPFLLTMGLTQRFTENIFRGLRSFSNISFIVAPDKLPIYSQFEHTEPLFVKVENGSPESMDLILSIEFPEKVVWNLDDQEETEKYYEEFTLNSGHSKRANFELKYVGTGRKTSMFDVQLIRDDVEKKQQVEVLLEPE